jgi:crotonobetainyl-CoA:carnitine CoA-transferase CaiB-like acyl-CoA transferase
VQDSFPVAATAQFLQGLRVLDFSIWRPGPYATSLLVPLGADVLKIEPPGGDPMRHYTGLFASINEGKRSVELDLKDAAGRARALELAGEADVLVEGFRPGVLARFGLDASAVRAANPAAVYCSISGYGQDDPRALLPGHDVNYQAWSGALTPEGGPATRVPQLPTADLAAGMTAAFGICAAVLGRATSGEGATLDISMTDVLATWTGPSGSRPAAGPDSPPEPAAPIPGYGLFTTADGGQVALGVLNEQHFWAGLCDDLGLEAVRDLGFEERCRRGASLQEMVGRAIAAQDRDAVVSRLVAAGVPVAPVLDRAGMLAAGPFPRFPIRLGLDHAPGPVPALDAHRGQGFPPRA